MGAERDEGWRSPMLKRAADALADEVAALVRRRVIDARSPAADALLDYRSPPSTPRADRLAVLEAERDAATARAAEAERREAAGDRVIEQQAAQIHKLQDELQAARLDAASFEDALTQEVGARKGAEARAEALRGALERARRHLDPSEPTTDMRVALAFAAVDAALAAPEEGQGS